MLFIEIRLKWNSLNNKICSQSKEDKKQEEARKWGSEFRAEVHNFKEITGNYKERVGSLQGDVEKFQDI